MSWYELLDELTSIPGPTGQEQDVMDWCQKRWSSRCEWIERSPTGNLYAKVGGTGRKVLIQAHADEIGFIVRSIDQNGFLHISTAQTMDDPAKRFPVGQPALVLGCKGPIDGLIATATGHVLTEEQRTKKGMTYHDFWVDIGVDSRDAAEAAGVHPGARVIWNPPLRQLRSRIYGKAIDDRMLIALMTALLEGNIAENLNCSLYFAVTVQEENGLIGANALFQDLKPDVAIALDVGLVGDIPSVSAQTMPTGLGKGPIIVHKDSSTHYNRELLWEVVSTAESNGIPIQHAIFERFGSDGAQFIRHGIPAILLCPPTRYTHSPFEMVDEADLDATTNLLKAFVTGE
ncbi:MAG: M20/M25/M40 family metallo-hydrolase [Thermomicrobiaceae bacterium]